MLSRPKAASVSPAQLFDAAHTRDFPEQLASVGMGVLALPGAQSPHVQAGDWLVTRARGEGRLGFLSAAIGPAATRGALETRGVRCEGRADGFFVEVSERESGSPRALRIAGPDGLLLPHVLLLRRQAAANTEQAAVLTPPTAAGAIAAPLGKGLFVGRLSESSTGSAAAMAARCRECSISWLALMRVGMPSPSGGWTRPLNGRELERYVPQLKAAAPEVGLWLWGWVHPLEVERAVDTLLESAQRLRVRGVIVDLEWPFRAADRRNAAVRAQLTPSFLAAAHERMLERLLSGGHAHGLSVGVTAIAFPHHLPLPVLSRADFGMPQLYYPIGSSATRGPDYPARALEQWRSAGFRCLVPVSRAFTGDLNAARLRQVVPELLARTPVPDPAIGFWAWQNSHRERLDFLWDTIRSARASALSAAAPLVTPAPASTPPTAAVAPTPASNAPPDHSSTGATEAADPPATQSGLTPLPSTAPNTPPPSAADYAAVAEQRALIELTRHSGLTLQQAVGATPHGEGNRPDDVRLVRRRLRELGGETPNTHEVSELGAGLRRFQERVRFWLERGEIRGAITAGVAAPGDATAQLLDRITVYELRLDDQRASFHDHVVTPVSVSARGVRFAGTSAPATLPSSDYLALGLSPVATAALRRVAALESNFDALDTCDRSRLSCGFIQFAGGRGLPRYLGLLKLRQPSVFRERLQRYGIDVELSLVDGRIAAAELVVVDPSAQRVLTGSDAERAIAADVRLCMVLIVAGRDSVVQRVQLEAAARDYLAPALAATVAWSNQRARLASVLPSERGHAVLLDRAFQEGLAGARERIEAVVRALHETHPFVNAAALGAREAELLRKLEQDAEAAADLSRQLRELRSELAALLAAARAPDATPDTLLAHAALAQARRHLAEALQTLARVVHVSVPAGSTRQATLQNIQNALQAARTHLQFDLGHDTVTELIAQLESCARTCDRASTPFVHASLFLHRIQQILQPS